MSTAFPEFFAAAPAIRLRDPLAAFLGAAAGGVIEYGYADVVKLAGHSCPTVASAYLMTRAALRRLYPDDLPERGGVRVAMPQPAHEGVSGVMGNVISMLTGAAGEGGFHGIGGRFDRRELLVFGDGAADAIVFRRLDNGAAVSAAAHPERVPGDPRVRELLPRCLAGTASEEQAALFGSLWQERVRRLLLEHADDPQVIVVEAVGPGA